MALQTVLEKLQLKDEKNILVQGLPSSIEKQFIKLTFAKSVTPLLRSRQIDFALVFAISRSQLTNILTDVISALHKDAKLWVAYPKPTAKIVSDLCRECNWDCITSIGFETMNLVELDNTWTAIQFKKASTSISHKKTTFFTAGLEEALNPNDRALLIPKGFKTAATVRKSKVATAVS